MVAVLEAGQRLEDHFSPEELASPAEPDPEHDKMWADYQSYLKTGKLGNQVTHLCNTCGGPVTRTIEIGGKTAHFCDRHDGTPTRPQLQPPPDPQAPATYIHSDFGKAPLDPRHPIDNRIIARRAVQEAATAGPAPTNRATVGPVDWENTVFLNRRD